MIRDMITKVDDTMNSSIQRFLTKMDLVEAGPFREFIFALDSDHIGSCVLRGARITQEIGNTATAICKRRFKWQDMIVLIALDEDEEGEAGIAFTEKGIYHWLEGDEFVAEVPYEDIGAVGYQGNYIIITRQDDSPVELFCGEDAEKEKYSRYMFNYICDIVDYFDANVRERAGAEERE